MKKLDIPCGEGCAAVIMEKHEIEAVSRLLHGRALSKEIEAYSAKLFEKEFNLAAGLIKEPEKPTADTESADAPF
jgi:hypothetical protein